MLSEDQLDVRGGSRANDRDNVCALAAETGKRSRLQRGSEATAFAAGLRGDRVYAAAPSCFYRASMRPPRHHLPSDG
jgi:hypothetical protein